MLGQAADQADFFGDRNEHVRADHPRERVDPAGQHLEADDLAGPKIDLGLEIGNELAVLETEADALLDLAMSDQRALHAGIEPDRPGNAAVAGMIHRDVRTAQDVRNTDVGRGGRGDSGERTDLDDPFFEQERPGHRPQDRLGKLVGAAHFVRASARATANSSPLRRASTASGPSSSASETDMVLSSRSPVS